MPARRVRIGQPSAYAQYPVSVSVSYVPPGKRNPWFMTAKPDNLTYFTVENESGDVLYDTREEVPCDMAKFGATRERFAKEWRDEGYEVIA
jgi:hypothetical protein